MPDDTLLRELTDEASRPDPYPLYSRFRETPVSRQADGVYVVSTHREVTELLHDPRVSSDLRNIDDPDQPVLPVRPFILRDGLDHDRLREATMRHFGPPETPTLVADQEAMIQRAIDDLLTGLEGRDQVDVVDDFAWPLPVQVICHLLGVPTDDQPKFHQWADDVVKSVGARDQADTEELVKLGEDTRAALFLYLTDLIARHRAAPSDCFLSNLANDPDAGMSDTDLAATGVLLLVAGHETTVNLIANGAVTLLRHPEVLDRLRVDDAVTTPLVEELLRFEPPVQYLPQRSALADIDIDGTTIPKGARIVLMLASASRDPDRFPDPDRFDPDRADNQHFGFGGGIHYCFGAPLARLETQLALVAFARRFRNPRLVADPPPYRPSPVLRGPRHVLVDVDGITR